MPRIRTLIYNDSNLFVWVYNQTCDWATPAEMEQIVRHIASIDWVPYYGEDWSDYLSRFDLEVIVS